ncbi:MAG: BTAD domain-containing putative transcriptional regulator [Arenicellales bacterium]|nr:BTAD domain-containing putative transcriptional regulator [Arenicellales bacterium]
MTQIRLKLLGEFECLAEDGTLVDIALAKDQGLLAILALSPDFKSSRSRIIGLLWSARGNEQARASLRQSLWSLKKSIGNSVDGVLQIDRRHIGLNPNSVITDVTRFHQLIASPTKESLEEAVELYHGDLLTGLEIRDRVWQEWLTIERESLRTRVVKALRCLIDHYGAGSQSEQLIEAGQKLVKLEPFQEEGYRAMMRGYAECDQRAMALKQYERCRELLQNELDTSPDSATRHLFSQVKDGSIGTGQNDRVVTSDIRSTSRFPLQPTSKVSQVLEELPRTGVNTSTPSILVMPFVNLSDDREQDYVARGITDNIIIALTRFRELFVFAYKTSLATEDMFNAATDAHEQLGARYAVEGAVQKTNNRIRVSARLIDAQTGRHLWAQNYDRDLHDLLTVQDEITGLVVNSLIGTVEETDHRRTLEKPPEELAAYDYVLKARVLLSRDRYIKTVEYEARDYYRKALELDQNYAPAYAGLAVSYTNELHCTWCEQPEQALSTIEKYANKALELDSTNSMARYALATAYYLRGEYERANLEIEHAITINPNDYHNVCAKAWFLTYSGHLQEGLQCSIDALRTNPYAADGCLETIGLAQYLSGDYGEALLAFGKTEYNSMFKLAGMAACYAQLGRLEEAKHISQEFIKISVGEESKKAPVAGKHWHSYWNRIYKFKVENDRQHFLEGLRKAGIPVS